MNFMPIEIAEVSIGAIAMLALTVFGYYIRNVYEERKDERERRKEELEYARREREEARMEHKIALSSLDACDTANLGDYASAAGKLRESEARLARAEASCNALGVR